MMVELPLFKRTGDRTPFPNATWWTWSNDVREVLDVLNDALPSLPQPGLVRLGAAVDYDHSYTLDPKKYLLHDLRAAISAIACSFHNFRVVRRRYMFSGLLRPTDSKNLLHTFFALIRHSIVDRTRQSTSAMYAPLGTIGAAAGEFRLHADLYRPRQLFNVFNDVPNDGTGASTFLAVASFKKILGQTPLLPRSKRIEIEALLRDTLHEDGYERFVGLVHDEANAWHDQLWTAMEQHQQEISLGRGDGYLLNDRAWLHGRTEPSNNVSLFRVHRLVFA